MKFRSHNLDDLADLICGNTGQEAPSDGEHLPYFRYRSSYYITRFFDELSMDYVHDGSTRHHWVSGVLEELLAQPHDGPFHPPEGFCRVIDHLMDQGDPINEGPDRSNALAELNAVLGKEGFEAFYGEDRHCYLRHIGTKAVTVLAANPHRPLTAAEQERRAALVAYLDRCSEDELIENVLLPMLRQLGFQRVTAVGHKDKALEYGNDLWMRYQLPTQHFLYFGIQVKKGKLDARGKSLSENRNVAEILNQAQMMLAAEIFDPETNRRVLVDHAFIVAGGEITKQAKNLLAINLDLPKRSQILFMDRDDLLNLFIVNNAPLPSEAVEPPAVDDEDPF